MPATTPAKSKSTSKTSKSRKAKSVSVAKSNVRFTKMTAAEKRVQIAKDVIAQLDVERLYAKQGIYVQGRNTLSNLKLTKGADYWSDEVQGTEVRDLLAPKCNVCAKGGLFVAAVDRFNKLKLQDDLCPIENYGFCVDPSSYLCRFFKYDQLELIEYAFENGGVGDAYGVEADAADRFSNKYPAANARMRAIMRNIIKNKGTFEP